MLFMFAASPKSAMAQDASSVDDLAWMSGCWASEGGEKGSGEQWMAPAGNSMLGMSRVVKDGETVGFEFVRIQGTESGGIEFIADPSGQEGASFQMVELSDHEVIFENLGHDFPQRIIYRLMENGNIAASIEGTIEGQLRDVEFPLERAKCPS